MNRNLVENSLIIPSIKLRKEFITSGNLICFNYKIEENDKQRIQKYKGLVISVQNRGISRTFKIRQTIQGVIVDQTFFLNSPKINSISLKKTYKIRRSKLFFISKYKSNLKILKLSN